MAYNPSALIEFKNGSTPATGTQNLGSNWEAEYDQLYGNWNHFFGAAGTTLTIDNITEITPANGILIEGVRLKDNHIGIGGGISTPSNPLHVQSTTTPQFRIAYDGSNYVTLGHDSSSFSITNSTGSINFNPGASNNFCTILGGAQFFVYDAADTNYLSISHNTVNGIINVSSGSITIPNTTNSSSSTTGAVIIGSGGNGGLGVAEDIYAGAMVVAGTTITAGTGITATTGNIVATAGAVSAGTTVTGGTGVVATTGNITATAGNIVATAGYFQSGKGRWPTGSFESSSFTLAQVFSAVSPDLPNTNDEILIHGGRAYTGSPGYINIYNRAVKYNSTTIRFYGLQYASDGSAVFSTYWDVTSTGGSVSGAINISW